MPLFDYLFRLQPEAVFGLAQQGWLVVPGGHQVIGPKLDTRTGNVVGAGSESVCRPADQGVKVHERDQSGEIILNDNYLTLRIEAPHPNDALPKAISMLNGILPLFSYEVGRVLTAEFVQATDEAGNRIPFPHEFGLLRIHAYNIDGVRNGFLASLRNTAVVATSPRLSTALHDFCKGLSLLELAHERAISPIRPAGQVISPLVAEAFLTFWKAIESILGTSLESAAFKRKVKLLGFSDDFIATRMEPLNVLRDGAGVAHAARTRVVDLADVGRVRDLASEILRAAFTGGALDTRE